MASLTFEPLIQYIRVARWRGAHRNETERDVGTINVMDKRVHT
jgi:hypothetical protein